MDFNDVYDVFLRWMGKGFIAFIIAVLIIKYRDRSTGQGLKQKRRK